MSDVKYLIGWSDYRAEHGTPNVDWPLLEYDHPYDLQEYLAYTGMAAGMSIAYAPLIWMLL